MATKTNEPVKRIYKWTIAINVIVVTTVCAVIFWAIQIYYTSQYHLYTDDAAIEEYITPVNTRIPGYLQRVKFDEHQFVKKGDTLAVIDNSEFIIQLEQAEAAYSEAMATRKVSTSSVSTIQSNISISDANISSAEARLANAEKNYNRYLALLNEGAATQQQFDQVKSDYHAMLSQKKALILQKQTTALSTREAQNKTMVNDAEVKRCHSIMDMARLNLSYTVILAPYDGITGRRNVQEGQYIQAGQSLLTFIREDKKWVVANFKETQLHKLQIGQIMNIKIDGLQGELLKGRIVAISGATGSRYSSIPTDNSSGNFVKVRQRIPVKIEFLDSNASQASIKKVRAGMNVEVSGQ